MVGGDYMAFFFNAAFPWVAMGLLVAFSIVFSDKIFGKQNKK